LPQTLPLERFNDGLADNFTLGRPGHGQEISETGLTAYLTIVRTDARITTMLTSTYEGDVEFLTMVGQEMRPTLHGIVRVARRLMSAFFWCADEFLPNGLELRCYPPKSRPQRFRLT
jgi:hypothetical protein